MEPALCEVCKDIRLGKILIQTNLDTGEPEVFILLDCIVNIFLRGNAICTMLDLPTVPFGTNLTLTCSVLKHKKLFSVFLHY